MSFDEEIKSFSKSITQKMEHIDTEETTKIALILPFLELLGYDTSNPGEVKAEYTADIGNKQGEKVDIALLTNNQPIIFIECKSVNTQLDASHLSQLYRYFSITDVKIGILTNGVNYQFFTTSKDNRMDDKPFLEINLLNISKNDVNELKKFIKENINVEEVITRADNLKYKTLIKKCLNNELSNPSDEFVKVIGKQVYDGVLTQSVKERFSTIISKVATEIINEKVEKRLSDAVSNNEEYHLDDQVEETEVKNNDGVVTIEEELEGYYIVKSIASELIDGDRVTMRDRKSYCNILLDNHQFYTILRLHFNNTDNLRIELFDNVDIGHNGMKIGEKISIEKVSELYNYKQRILSTIKEYIEVKDKKA